MIIFSKTGQSIPLVSVATITQDRDYARIGHVNHQRVVNILGNIDDIPFVHFDSKDVVRHKLVTKIINAYDKYEFRSTRA